MNDETPVSVEISSITLVVSDGELVQSIVNGKDVEIETPQDSEQD